MAIVVLFTLGMGLVVFILVRDDEGDDEAQPAPDDESDEPEEDDPPDVSTADLPPDVQEAVEEASTFVEEQRELEFTGPVDIALLEEDPFQQRLRDDLAEGFEEQADEIPHDEAFLVAFGLAPDDVDLLEQAEQYLTGAVLAFYDTETNELVMRGTDATPAFRSTLVHELTHAIDDQHFELYREELEDIEDEQPFAFDALTEGNAMRVQTAYEAELSSDEYSQLLQEQLSFAGDVDFGAVLDVLISSNEWLYIGGRQFAADVADAGGEAAIDEALTVPPTTSEQVIDPALFLEDEPVIEVAPPEADGTVTDEGVLGQWLLYYLVDGFDPLFEPTLEIGWGGDAYVQWDEGDRSCVRSNIVGDTPGDTDAWVEELGEWAAEQGDAQVERQGDFAVLTVCG